MPLGVLSRQVVGTLCKSTSALNGSTCQTDLENLRGDLLAGDHITPKSVSRRQNANARKLHIKGGVCLALVCCCIRLLDQVASVRRVLGSRIGRQMAIRGPLAPNMISHRANKEMWNMLA